MSAEPLAGMDVGSFFASYRRVKKSGHSLFRGKRMRGFTDIDNEEASLAGDYQ